MFLVRHARLPRRFGARGGGRRRLRQALRRVRGRDDQAQALHRLPGGLLLLQGVPGARWGLPRALQKPPAGTRSLKGLCSFRFSFPLFAARLSTSRPYPPFHSSSSSLPHLNFPPTRPYQKLHWVEGDHKTACKLAQQAAAAAAATAVAARPPRNERKALLGRVPDMVNRGAHLCNSGQPSEAIALLTPLIASLEAAVGPNDFQLVEPLRVVAYAHDQSGRLSDSYCALLRAMTLSEEHSGADGTKASQLRTQLG